jgi:acetyltransferase-like isoleucine patch superfamily enzyme
MHPKRMVAQALSVLPRSPLLAAKRLTGYLLNPSLGHFFSAWHRFERWSQIAPSCWLGANAWCSTHSHRPQPERIRIGARSVIRGVLRIEDGGRIVIGENCYVGDDCILDSAESIVIGANTWLAHGVSVFDNDSHPLSLSARLEQAAAYRSGRLANAPRPASAPVHIGEFVWIGFNSFISKGVSIAERSIVAACSVVTKDVPADCLVAGNPARVVRSLVSEHLSA